MNTKTHCWLCPMRDRDEIPCAPCFGKRDDIKEIYEKHYKKKFPKQLEQYL